MTNKPFAITLEVGSSRANKTGTWRTERPVYVDRMPPCNTACPAGENIQSWLYEAEAGGDGYERAWRKIMEENPFPAIMGRVCYHSCETACNRATLDEAVGINEVERFLGDLAIEKGWSVSVEAAPSGKRVLVVGAGPCGLSAAYHLARLGHEVTVRDAGSRAGGMMRFGIPRYRLPRDILDAEIARIEALGVRIELETHVTDALGAMRDGGFDAVFVAVGAQIGKRAYVPAGEAAHIVDAVTLLRSMEGEERPALGRRVAVYGGGNTAMDAARTARRLGAEEAIVIYRRTRDRMPAHDFEVEEAEDEGIKMKWLSTVKHADGGKLVLERMELDEAGFPQPTGELEELEADSLVLALGQEADVSLLDVVPGVVIDDRVVEVDAGLDDRPSRRLRRRRHRPRRAHRDGRRRTRQAGRTLYRRLAPRADARAPARAAARRLSSSSTRGTTRTHRSRAAAPRAGTAAIDLRGGRRRSRRGHGSSRRAAACRAATASTATTASGSAPTTQCSRSTTRSRYAIDYDYCKGCGICAAECPCGAIAMVDEDV